MFLDIDEITEVATLPPLLVIHSNSEGRPIPNRTEIISKPNSNIRGVSSHEDFHKTNNSALANNISDKTTESLIIEENGTKNKKVSPCRDISADICMYDECEYEKHDAGRDSFHKITAKRHFENGIRRKEFKPEDKDLVCDFLQLRCEEKERSPTTVHTPILHALDLI
ncbi:hypothetical protein QE152_g23797 [Popillia japonica]|uniref:Uncharacterized protein n=1 Tax=Popillia japonica TaxID=7064 RepID=A0AAW1KGG5_POPJA